MKSVYITVILLFFIPSHSQADDWNNKRMMSLCSINHIQIKPWLIIRIRDDSEESAPFCPKCNSDDLADLIVGSMKKNAEKRREIEQNILNLYSSRIMNTIGINTSKTEPENSFSASLHIRVDINDTGSRSPLDGKRFYGIMHEVSLFEEGQSRFGRKDLLRLDTWVKGGSADTLAGADMEAINLVTQIVNKMNETFKEAKVYCANNNLLQ